MRARHIIAFLTLILALPASVATAGPWLIEPGEYFTEFRGSRASTSKFRDDGGTSRDLWGKSEMESRSVVAHAELGWRENMSIALGVPFQSETVRLGSSGFNSTETAFGDFTLDVRYGLTSGANALSLEANWIAPLGADRFAELRELQLALLQDASPDTLNRSLARRSLAAVDPGQTLGLQLLYGASLPALNGFFQAAVGGQYMFNAEALNVVASTQFGVWLGDPLFVGVEYDLAMASEYPFIVRHDAQGLQVIEKRDMSRHLAGPKLVLRVDDNVDVIAGSRHLVSGTNTFGMNEIYVGVAFKQTNLNRLQGFLGGTSRP